MKENKPIDKYRDGSGKAEIGVPAEGAIVEMFNMNDRLLVIKERAVYEFILADQIDPQREFPNLPANTQRLILKLGTESEIFSRTFLTAKNLFKKEFLPSYIDMGKAFSLALEVTQEIAAFDEHISDYLKYEKKEIDDYDERKRSKADHTIPSIVDIETRCKTIFQKADQALQAQIDLIRIFYPNFSEKSYYTKFYDFLNNEFGETDDFTEFMKDILSSINLVRNIRNCLEHRRTEIIVKDFELQSDSSILSPTVEIEYLNSNLKRIALATYLPIVSENLVTIFESMIAYLCNKNIREDIAIPLQVLNIPEDRRINKYIGYAYFSPFGDGGYYYQ